MADDCVFCKIVKGDMPSQKLMETANFIVIKDVFPKVEGHSLVIPKQHFETFLDLPVSLHNEFIEVIKKSIPLLLSMFNSNGYNLVMNNKSVAGQIVPHMHMHILPRKEGDNFRLKV